MNKFTMQFFLLSVLITFSVLATEQKLPEIKSSEFKLTKVIEGDGVIWGFDFISSSEILYTVKKGQLFYYNLNTKEKIKLETPKVKRKGQGGLLDIYIHNLKEKTFVYMTYSHDNGKNVATALARAEYKNKKLLNLKQIFRTKINGDSGVHFGSRLVVKDNFLYMTVGERGQRDYAQKLDYHNGKILRLTLEGKAAQANPFRNAKNALPEIWSYGHRNPQGIDIDPVSGEIYSCEFGPRGGDELNLIKKGKNYGWPEITYGKEYWGPTIGTTKKAGMEQPVTYWDPSISPSGMTFYVGDKISEWKNDLFLANLSSKHIRRIVLKNNKVIKQEVVFADLEERIRQVKSGPDGFFYFSTDSGKIVRVEKK